MKFYDVKIKLTRDQGGGRKVYHFHLLIFTFYFIYRYRNDSCITRTFPTFWSLKVRGACYTLKQSINFLSGYVDLHIQNCTTESMIQTNI